MANRTKEVNQFMKNLEHPLKEEIERVRAIILDSDTQITEHVKWNAPGFCYDGEDRVTFRLHPGNRLQLVFHRCAKKKDSTNFVFVDSTGLLQWVTDDRAVITFHDTADVEAKKTLLTEVVGQWMNSTRAYPVKDQT